MSASSCSSLALSPVSGSKLQICLSRITSSKTCCTRDRVAQRVEVDDAVLLGQVVGVAAGPASARMIRSRMILRRHVRLHRLPWSGAGCSRASAAAAASAGVSGGMRPGSTKAKMLTRSSGAVLDGRAGHGPAPRSRWSAAHHLGRLRVAVLDALGLVEHHHVEVHPRRRRASSASRVSSLVVDQLERAVGHEPRASGARPVSPPNDLERQVGGPQSAARAPS